MKYKGSINIEKPRSEVVKYFADPKYNGEYQDGFLRKEEVSEVPGEEGAVAKMFYKYGKNEMELTETITSNKLPDRFEAFYHHKHMDNTMKCIFIEINEKSTKYEYEFEYTRINWFMPKLIALLFPGIYRKQGEKWMRQFKEFVEKQ